MDLSMKARNLPSALLGLLLLSLFLVASCAPDQFTKKDKKPKGEVTAEDRSRREMEDRVLESSWYEGGDYYRNRDDEGAIDVGKWFRDRKEMQAKQEETEKRLAKLEKEVQGQQTAETQRQGAGAAVVAYGSTSSESQQAVRFKVAMVVNPDVYETSPEVKTALLETATGQFAQNQKLILVQPEEVEEILEQRGLGIRKGKEQQIAKALGVYPAARLVVFVNKISTQRQTKEVTGSLRYTLFDGLSGRLLGREEETVSSARAGADEMGVLPELLAEMILALEKKAANYTWFSRVAMLKGETVYLTAGEASGLNKGDILAVYGPGKEIIHPLAKVSMGFQEGPYKGTVKVVSLFGQDAAEATVLEGSNKIEANDLVTLPSEQK
jgi:hypothetical protein